MNVFIVHRNSINENQCNGRQTSVITTHMTMFSWTNMSSLYTIPAWPLCHRLKIQYLVSHRFDSKQSSLFFSCVRTVPAGAAECHSAPRFCCAIQRHRARSMEGHDLDCGRPSGNHCHRWHHLLLRAVLCQILLQRWPQLCGVHHPERDPQGGGGRHLLCAGELRLKDGTALRTR